MSRYKCIKVMMLISLVISTCHLSIRASEVEDGPASMGIPGAPLGTVWVRAIEPRIHAFHQGMLKADLEDAKSSDSLTANVAMFALTVFKKNPSEKPVTVLGNGRELFRSGGAMLIEPTFESPIHTFKNINDEETVLKSHLEVASKNLGIAKGKLPAEASKIASRIADEGTPILPEVLSKIESLGEGIKLAKEELDRWEASHAAFIAAKESNTPEVLRSLYSSKDKRSDYDSEHNIVRLIDFHMRKATIVGDILTFNDQEIKVSEIDYLILSIHTRLDMCPFCSMFLAHSMQEWKRKLGAIPFITVVSSRLENASRSPFIVGKSYYKSFNTMRSFGWRAGDDGSTIEGLKAIAADGPDGSKGLVVQFAFEPWEVYPVWVGSAADAMGRDAASSVKKE